ncbi:MAG: hypothetical protein CVU46_16920 [Chloroflexi bacterium HGW-Chloroflexi-8]|nr:MAG: hypothetical protein CVU46_16920 [Chloroflexi bacterium HGW-Chloroflexi-8]
MQSYLLVTCEILVIVVMPLLVLYRKGNWPLRKIIPSLVVIPVIWYFSYSIVHELSHAAGTYLVGGKVIDYRLIPRFWLGEFRGAWATPGGLTQSWQQLTAHVFPYLMDIVCFVSAILIFRRGSSRNPFVIGIAFMLLCLRPAFNILGETIGLLTGWRGDLYNMQQIVGPFALWSFILFSIGLAIYSTSSTLSHLVRFSKQQIRQNADDTKHNIVQKGEKNDD